MFSSDSTPSTPIEVRAAVIERLSETLSHHRVTSRDDDMFALAVMAKDNPSEVLVVHLHSLVAQVLEPEVRPAEARAAIARFVRMVECGATPPRISLDAVYPTFRSRQMLAAARDGGLETDPFLAQGPGDLWLVVLADIGDGVVTVSDTVAARSGHSVEEVIGAAERNLRNIAPRVFLSEPEDGVVPVGIEGYPWLGASLLLVPGFLRAIAEAEGWTRPMVAAPGHDVVGLIDAAQPQARERLEAWMVREGEASGRLSDVVFSVGGDNALRPAFRCDGSRLLAVS